MADLQDIGEPDISDPEVYWPMAIYSLKISNVLMHLRHLYEPAEAMRWLTSPQPLLANRVPADMMLVKGGSLEVGALIQRILDGAYV